MKNKIEILVKIISNDVLDANFNIFTKDSKITYPENWEIVRDPP